MATERDENGRLVVQQQLVITNDFVPKTTKKPYDHFIDLRYNYSRSSTGKDLSDDSAKLAHLAEEENYRPKRYFDITIWNEAPTLYLEIEGNLSQMIKATHAFVKQPLVQRQVAERVNELEDERQEFGKEKFGPQSKMQNTVTELGKDMKSFNLITSKKKRAAKSYFNTYVANRNIAFGLASFYEPAAESEEKSQISKLFSWATDSIKKFLDDGELEKVNSKLASHFATTVHDLSIGYFAHFTPKDYRSYVEDHLHEVGFYLNEMEKHAEHAEEKAKSSEKKCEYATRQKTCIANNKTNIKHQKAALAVSMLRYLQRAAEMDDPLFADLEFYVSQQLLASRKGDKLTEAFKIYDGLIDKINSNTKKVLGEKEGQLGNFRSILEEKAQKASKALTPETYNSEAAIRAPKFQRSQEECKKNKKYTRCGDLSQVSWMYRFVDVHLPNEYREEYAQLRGNTQKNSAKGTNQQSLYQCTDEYQQKLTAIPPKDKPAGDKSVKDKPVEDKEDEDIQKIQRQRRQLIKHFVEEKFFSLIKEHADEVYTSRDLNNDLYTLQHSTKDEYSVEDLVKLFRFDEKKKCFPLLDVIAPFVKDNTDFTSLINRIKSAVEGAKQPEQNQKKPLGINKKDISTLFISIMSNSQSKTVINRHGKHLDQLMFNSIIGDKRVSFLAEMRQVVEEAKSWFHESEKEKPSVFWEVFRFPFVTLMSWYQFKPSSFASKYIWESLQLRDDYDAIEKSIDQFEQDKELKETAASLLNAIGDNIEKITRTVDYSTKRFNATRDDLKCYQSTIDRLSKIDPQNSEKAKEKLTAAVDVLSAFDWIRENADVSEALVGYPYYERNGKKYYKAIAKTTVGSTETYQINDYEITDDTYVYKAINGEVCNFIHPLRVNHKKDVTTRLAKSERHVNLLHEFIFKFAPKSQRAAGLKIVGILKGKIYPHTKTQIEQFEKELSDLVRTSQEYTKAKTFLGITYQSSNRKKLVKRLTTYLVDYVARVAPVTNEAATGFIRHYDEQTYTDFILGPGTADSRHRMNAFMSHNLDAIQANKTQKEQTLTQYADGESIYQEEEKAAQGDPYRLACMSLGFLCQFRTNKYVPQGTRDIFDPRKLIRPMYDHDPSRGTSITKFIAPRNGDMSLCVNEGYQGDHHIYTDYICALFTGPGNDDKRYGSYNAHVNKHQVYWAAYTLRRFEELKKASCHGILNQDIIFNPQVVNGKPNDDINLFVRTAMKSEVFQNWIQRVSGYVPPKAIGKPNHYVNLNGDTGLQTLYLDNILLNKENDRNVRFDGSEIGLYKLFAAIAEGQPVITANYAAHIAAFLMSQQIQLNQYHKALFGDVYQQHINDPKYDKAYLCKAFNDKCPDVLQNADMILWGNAKEVVDLVKKSEVDATYGVLRIRDIEKRLRAAKNEPMKEQYNTDSGVTLFNFTGNTLQLTLTNITKNETGGSHHDIMDKDFFATGSKYSHQDSQHFNKALDTEVRRVVTEAYGKCKINSMLELLKSYDEELDNGQVLTSNQIGAIFAYTGSPASSQVLKDLLILAKDKYGDTDTRYTDLLGIKQQLDQRRVSLGKTEIKRFLKLVNGVLPESERKEAIDYFNSDRFFAFVHKFGGHEAKDLYHRNRIEFLLHANHAQHTDAYKQQLAKDKGVDVTKQNVLTSDLFHNKETLFSLLFEHVDQLSTDVRSWTGNASHIIHSLLACDTKTSDQALAIRQDMDVQGLRHFCGKGKIVKHYRHFAKLKEIAESTEVDKNRFYQRYKYDVTETNQHVFIVKNYEDKQTEKSNLELKWGDEKNVPLKKIYGVRHTNIIDGERCTPPEWIGGCSYIQEITMNMLNEAIEKNIRLPDEIRDLLEYIATGDRMGADSNLSKDIPNSYMTSQGKTQANDLGENRSSYIQKLNNAMRYIAYIYKAYQPISSLEAGLDAANWQSATTAMRRLCNIKLIERENTVDVHDKKVKENFETEMADKTSGLVDKLQNMCASTLQRYILNQILQSGTKLSVVESRLQLLKNSLENENSKISGSRGNKNLLPITKMTKNAIEIISNAKTIHDAYTDLHNKLTQAKQSPDCRYEDLYNLPTLTSANAKLLHETLLPEQRQQLCDEIKDVIAKYEEYYANKNKSAGTRKYQFPSLLKQAMKSYANILLNGEKPEYTKTLSDYQKAHGNFDASWKNLQTYLNTLCCSIDKNDTKIRNTEAEIQEKVNDVFTENEEQLDVLNQLIFPGKIDEITLPKLTNGTTNTAAAQIEMHLKSRAQGKACVPDKDKGIYKHYMIYQNLRKRVGMLDDICKQYSNNYDQLVVALVNEQQNLMPMKAEIAQCKAVDVKFKLVNDAMMVKLQDAVNNITKRISGIVQAGEKGHTAAGLICFFLRGLADTNGCNGTQKASLKESFKKYATATCLQKLENAIFNNFGQRMGHFAENQASYDGSLFLTPAERLILIEMDDKCKKSWSTAVGYLIKLVAKGSIKESDFIKYTDLLETFGTVKQKEQVVDHFIQFVEDGELKPNDVKKYSDFCEKFGTEKQRNQVKGWKNPATTDDVVDANQNISDITTTSVATM